MKAFGKILKGKIVFDNEAKFLNEVKKLHEGARVVISINEAEDVRSNQQNRLWWKWMTIIGQELGNNSQEINDILKYKFLLREETIEGERHQYIKSTSTLTKKEFSELVNNVFYWANDTLNIKLPTND